MRRIAMLVGTVVGVAIGIFIGSIWLTNAGAQDERTLDLRLIHRVGDDPFYEVGSDCRFPPTGQSPAIAGGKVVVRDETGTIILVSDELWSTFEPVDTGSGLQCRLETSLALPDAAFYEVYWGDVWMTAYSADALPLSEPLEVVTSLD